MKYISTRSESKEYSLGQALKRGICPKGGLFVPKKMPKINLKNFSLSDDYHSFSLKLLSPFFADDQLEKHLSEIIGEAFNFSVPWIEIEKNHYQLQLFHGPTAAFKDIGARFLASCFSKLGEQKMILVATSGDTGGAVASAFYRKKNMKVVILFPRDGVSPLQKKQLTCWNDNILSLEVDGDFDSCQKLVKEAFLDQELCAKFALTSANSINIGRLLPQITYYAYCAYNLFQKLGSPLPFIIPSGNMGNGMAAVWCKQMGFPLGKIHFACNQNRAICDFFENKTFTSRSSIRTLANAMDVGNPSNIERLLFGARKNSSLLADLSASWHSDEEISKIILEYSDRHNLIVCPHTAVALSAYHKFFQPADAVSVATAHAFKFNEVVGHILGHENIVMPLSLIDLVNRASLFQTMPARFQSLVEKLENF